MKFTQDILLFWACFTGLLFGVFPRQTLADQYSDPEPGTIRFASATYQVDEGHGTVVLTVQRVSGSDGAVGISYATSNGTANAPGDYTAKSGTLSWANGDSANKTITITIIDDGLAEVSETFFVTLSSPTGGATRGTPYIATVTIIDNEPRVTLSMVGDTSANEDAAGVRTFRATLDRTSALTVTVPFTLSGTATNAGSNLLSNGWLRSDLTRWSVNQEAGGNGTVTRDSTRKVFGTHSAKFEASTMTGWMILEYSVAGDLGESPFNTSQEYTLSFWARSQQERDVHVAIARNNNTNIVADFGYISTDNEWKRYDFSFSPSLAGSWPNIRFRVDSGNLPITLYIDGLRLVEGTSPAPFGDYQLLTSTPLVYTPGQTQKDIDVHVIADPFWESNETITATLGNPTHAGLGATTARTFTVTNDDSKPTVTITGPAEVSEADESFTLAVNLTHGFFETSQLIPFNYSNSSAIHGTHFTGPHSVTYQPGDTSKNLVLELINDGLFNLDRVLLVELDLPSSINPGTPPYHEVLITEANPRPVATILGGRIAYENQGQLALLIQLSSSANGIDIPISFDLSGSAISGEDYVAPSSVIIVAGDDRGEAIFTILDNEALDEDTRSVILEVETSVFVDTNESSVHTFEILDDEVALLPQLGVAHDRIRLSATVHPASFATSSHQHDVALKWSDKQHESQPTYTVWRGNSQGSEFYPIATILGAGSAPMFIDRVEVNRVYTYFVTATSGGAPDDASAPLEVSVNAYR